MFWLLETSRLLSGIPTSNQNHCKRIEFFKKNDKAAIVFVLEPVFLNSHCRNCTVLFVFYNATESEKMGV